MKAERRLSITPLVEALNLAPGESVSRALGISGSALTAYTTCGMEERTADRLAARAGFVSWVLWPELLEDAIEDVTRECEADDCNRTFVPPSRAPFKRFCTPACRKRVQRREQYRNDPSFRERVLGDMKRYYEETRTYQVKRARWYREQARRRAA